MTDVIISGILGRMGQATMRACFESDDINVVAGIDKQDGSVANIPVYNDFAKCREKADVVIDFTISAFTDAVVDFCTKTSTKLVMCTTGQDDRQLDSLRELSRKAAVFKSGNMSLGINLLMNAAKNAAKLLGKSFDIEIVEKHHRNKLDAPSGTALMLADAVNASGEYKYVFERESRREKRSDNEIGIHSIRGGTIVGEHDVIFAGTDEIVTFSHSALSRDVFATGAVAAAKFLSNKTAGYYSMNELIDSIM